MIFVTGVPDCFQEVVVAVNASDIFGRKPLYVFSIGAFVVGSLLCGTATSMYQLAAYRGIQGLGAGGLMALALIILGDMLSPRERTKYQAFFFGVWGVASVLGPVLGGFFADAAEVLTEMIAHQPDNLEARYVLAEMRWWRDHADCIAWLA